MAPGRPQYAAGVPSQPFPFLAGSRAGGGRRNRRRAPRWDARRAPYAYTAVQERARLVHRTPASSADRTGRPSAMQGHGPMIAYGTLYSVPGDEDDRAEIEGVADAPRLVIDKRVLNRFSRTPLA